MRTIVVNDTNVFIDLLSIQMLDRFFMLPWEIHTTDFVMFELSKGNQKENVELYQQNGQLHVASFEGNEMTDIANLYQKNSKKSNVSFTDCSVWYYAKVHNYVLLTGDRKLKSVVARDNIEVHGVLYIFDSLVEERLVSFSEAVIKLKELYKINQRLPKEEIEKRIKVWKEESL